MGKVISNINAIAFNDNIMKFRISNGDCIPEGCVVIENEGMEECFYELTHGKDVYIPYCDGWKQKLSRHIDEHFIYVRAAGGVVTAPDGERLMIFREGRWDLPKGMVELGESTEHAAVREVQEETGVGDITLGPLLLTTLHIYDKYGGWHIKETYWYEMFTQAKKTPSPQTVENISEAVWTKPELYRQRLSQSFASLRMLMDI